MKSKDLQIPYDISQPLINYYNHLLFMKQTELGRMYEEMEYEMK